MPATALQELATAIQAAIGVCQTELPPGDAARLHLETALRRAGTALTYVRLAGPLPKARRARRPVVSFRVGGRR